MAKRRMFSLDVVDTDSFLDLPASSQSLYFHLGMRADDDGFVSSPKRITAMVGAAGDDLKLLIAKGFVIPFESRRELFPCYFGSALKMDGIVMWIRNVYKMYPNRIHR